MENRAADALVGRLHERSPHGASRSPGSCRPPPELADTGADAVLLVRAEANIKTQRGPAGLVSLFGIAAVLSTWGGTGEEVGDGGVQDAVHDRGRDHPIAGSFSADLRSGAQPCEGVCEYDHA